MNRNGARPAIGFFNPDELLELPEPTWLVEPFIPAGAMVVLFGATSTFKSFVAVDLAGKAEGLAVYLSAEGSPRRFGERIRAWETAADRKAEILVHPYSVDLLGHDAGALTDAIRDLGDPVNLIVVDTIARNSAGADENSAQDTGRLVDVFDRLRAEFGCAILAIHHTGVHDTDRERGSSSLRGAADVSIRARRVDQAREVRLECVKMRDGEEFETRVVRMLDQSGSLVAADAVTRHDAVEQDVLMYLAEHPGASQREVEKAVTGRAGEIRAAYRKGASAASQAGTHREQGASRGGASLKDAPRTQLQALDPDEWQRAAVQDGGW